MSALRAAAMARFFAALAMAASLFTSAVPTGPAAARQESEQSTLPNLGCAEEGHVRSLYSTVQSRINFVNRSASTFRIYWLNLKGERKFYTQVDPGKNFVELTYYTHFWLIANYDDKSCIGIYRATPEAETVVIR